MKNAWGFLKLVSKNILVYTNLRSNLPHAFI